MWHRYLFINVTQSFTMKKIITVFVMLFMLAGSYKAAAQINAGISFNTFYTELSPYGRWIDYPQYGQVWISNETGFEPYSTNGYWEYTNYGWMWVSNYAWGWAPFHYGRWAYLNHYGWAWVPGYEWAPAWVGWCNYGGYYGWAPLSPGLGFNYSFSSIPYNYWRFVRHQYINNRNVHRHYQRPAINSDQYNNITVINNTVVNNNTTYIAGPPREQAESYIRKKIEPKQVAFSEQGVKRTEVLNKKEIRVYRPVAEKTAAVKTGQPAIEKEAVPVAAQPNSIQQQQQIRRQQQVITKQPATDNETPVPQQNHINKQKPIIRQQEQAVRSETIRKQQAEARQQEQAVERETIRRQQAEARQQELTRRQQQQAVRQQEQQMRQQRQNEIRQPKVQQPAQQPQWSQPSFPQRQVQPQRQPLPAKQGRKVLQ